MSTWLVIFAIINAVLIDVNGRADFRFELSDEGKIIGIYDRTLDSTSLKKLVDTLPQAIDNVKSVSIGMRTIQVGDITSLSQLPNLEYLDLGDHPDSVPLDEKAAKNLGVLKGLRGLSVYTSSNPEAICVAISALPHLKYLHLSVEETTDLTDLPNMNLCNGLESLSIEGNIRVGKSLVIKNLPNLTTILLNVKSIEPALVEQIVSCDNLEEISVHGYVMNSEVWRKFSSSNSANTIKNISVTVDSDFIFQGLLMANVQHLGITCTEEIDFPTEFFRANKFLKSVVIRGVKSLDKDHLLELLKKSSIESLIVYPIDSTAHIFTYQSSQNKR